MNIEEFCNISPQLGSEYEEVPTPSTLNLSHSQSAHKFISQSNIVSDFTFSSPADFSKNIGSLSNIVTSNFSYYEEIARAQMKLKDESEDDEEFITCSKGSEREYDFNFNQIVNKVSFSQSSDILFEDDDEDNEDYECEQNNNLDFVQSNFAEFSGTGFDGTSTGNQKINLLAQSSKQAQQHHLLQGMHLNDQNKQNQQKKTDRFIPCRQSSLLDIALTEAHETDENQPTAEMIKGRNFQEENSQSILQMYQTHVLGLQEQQVLLPQSDQDVLNSNNIFRFNDSPQRNQSNRGPLISLEDMILNQSIISNYSNSSSKKNVRKISQVPFKVLDAPSLQDDFYLNLVDWSSQNTLAVALASCVYLWSATNNKVTKFCDLGVSDSVTSITWNPRGTCLSIGTSLGETQVWDATKLQQIVSYGGHTARVGSLAWSNQILSSGSRDQSILYHDPRVQSPYVNKLVAHKQEVCGLRWSFDDQQLASGGNDNKLYVWGMHSNNPVAKFSNHSAAVKAIAWSPHQHGLLASGGGTADRTIRFWNTLNNTQVDWIDTGSQVCNLMFSKNVNELVSTHGYSQNQIVVWRYPSMQKITDLTGHTSRVLYLAMSPDGETIVTGAGDETLRFWNIFPQKESNVSQSSLLVGGLRDFR